MDNSVLKVKQQLHTMILDAVKAGVAKLPSEPELAQTLGVSRETIRASVAALQKEGLVNRLHGKGTFINSGAVLQRGNLIQGKPFLEMIEETGCKATTEAFDLGCINFSDKSAIGDMLRRYVKNGELKDGACRVVKRRFFGGDCPIICAIDFISPYSDPALERDTFDPGDSIYAMARLNMGQMIAYSVMEILPTTACDYLSAELDIDAGASLLLLKHGHYFQREHNPIAITCAFVNTERITMSIVRTGYT